MNRTWRDGARFAALLGVLLVFCAFLSPSWAQGPALQNANFDAGFTVRESQEVEVAVGWDYSYLSGDDRWCRAPCYRPEWKPEREIAVAGTSQRWFTTFARQYAAIHQSVDVEPGQWYRFACQVYAISEPDGQLAVRVGANPWNAGAFDSTMVWGQQQPWGQYREWHEVEVVFQAWGERVRVAVGSMQNYPVKNGAAYVDNCRLELADFGNVPTPECPACPGCPPCEGDGCDVETIQAALLEVLRGLRWRVD